MKQALFVLLCTTLSLHSQAQSSDNIPFVLGRTLDLNSAILSENRTLNIYLPEGYNANDTLRYPVIYLLDGSADEDFIHITGLVQYATFSWIDWIPQSIIVGIANKDRRRDFTYPTNIEQDKKDYPTTGGSEKFIAFIEKELQPFIEKRFKTTNSQTLIGQSFGGLLASEILLKKPTLFDNYLIISPSLWWDKESLLALDSPLLKSDFNQKTDVYIAVGNEGPVMVGDAKKLSKKIEKAANKNIRLRFEYFEAEDHATILHPAVYQAFKTYKVK